MLNGWERGGVLFLCGLLLLLVVCTTAPPQNINNACAIFSEYDDWYDGARTASERWGVPIPVLLAIIRHESAFEADAKPPRTRIFWIFPGPHRSSAYGYSQALDGTWDWYRQATGKNGADRTDFGDAVDFVGWYVNETSLRNRIPKYDAYRQYLAYHEGHSGYARGSYRKKPWLIKTAQRVRRQADLYRRQLNDCDNRLVGGWGRGGRFSRSAAWGETPPIAKGGKRFHLCGSIFSSSSCSAGP